MKVEKQTVWKDDTGVEVLRKTGDDAYYVPLATANRERLRSLRDACDDALKPAEEGKVSA